MHTTTMLPLTRRLSAFVSPAFARARTLPQTCGNRGCRERR